MSSQKSIQEVFHLFTFSLTNFDGKIVFYFNENFKLILETWLWSKPFLKMTHYQILDLLSWDFKVFVRKSDIFIRWVLQKNGFDNFCIFKMHASFSIMFIPLRFVMSSIVQNPFLHLTKFLSNEVWPINDFWLSQTWE